MKNAKTRRKEKRAKIYGSSYAEPESAVRIIEKKEPKPLRALTEAQGQYIASIISNTITFGIGPQGTGKSYVAGAWAADQLKQGLCEKLIITRPVIESGRNMGALPGTLEEKFAPFMKPFNSVLEERLGKTFFEYLKKTGKIEAYPLEYMRGETFNNSLVILDEAQNATDDQLLMFMTRIGEGSKMIIDGSITQCDIRNSGLQNAVRRLRSVQEIGVVEFDIDDIVRHGLIKEILRAYE